MYSIRSLFNNCWICGAPTFSDFELCQHCVRHIPQAERIRVTNAQLAFPALSLWEWSAQRNLWATPVLKRLKYKPLMPIHEMFAKCLVDQALALGRSRFDSPTVLLPAPASRPGLANHAVSLCRALSSILGSPVEDLLAKSPQQQKKLSKGERASLSFQINDQASFSRNTAWIFVDDVITTGSTAHAAYRALGCPQKFEAWSLFYRSPCPKNKLLL